ncbi:S-adenosyl-L-methionine-dependent methyltransferase [Globomyces pollinis-pini]|nr:S-adenosyl-L-methionine-dependent methyltransferase [Globomyces pollinis-pini]
METETDKLELRVLDFYSGLGGFHCALSKLNIPFTVVKAFDMNVNANQVYKNNFNTDINHKNIGFLTSEQLQNFESNLWVLSPPCQPYSRKGDRKGALDTRSDSFLQLLKHLEVMDIKPTYIVIENVLGFEKSDTFEILDQSLRNCGYQWQTIQANPLDYGVPYSRPRIFVLASLVEFSQPELNFTFYQGVPNHIQKQPNQLSNYLEEDEPIWVSDSNLWKGGLNFDMVHESESRSCCFTKAYGQFAKGGGSVIRLESDVEKVDAAIRRYKDMKTTALQNSNSKDWWVDLGPCPLSELQIRYFSPREIANLHGLPKSFKLEGVPTNILYRLLGNSMHIDVVASVLNYLFDSTTLQKQ